VLNGIYIFISISYTSIDKYYNKFKCTFDIIQHKNTIENIRKIEEDILKKININGKNPQLKIYEHLSNGNIKFFSDNMEKVNNEIHTIHVNCGCDYLEDLLTAVFIAHTKVLTAIRLSSNNKKVEINIPKVEHFLFKVLSRDVYR
jgi:hypothetical protein